VIDRPACHDVHTSVHELSLCTPNLPWGVPLSECPSCGSNLHLKATHGHTLKATVKCHRCGRGGQASYPNADGGSLIFVDRPQFRHQSLPAIMAAYPRPPLIQVDWEDEATPQAPISAHTGYPISLPTSPPSKICSSCQRYGNVISCGNAKCEISLCISRGTWHPGCLSVRGDDDELQHRWYCPSHDIISKSRVGRSSYFPSPLSQQRIRANGT